MLIRTVTKSDNIEKENLEAHVEICVQRYTAIEQRITAAEEILREIEVTADRNRQSIIQTMVAGGTLLAVVIPTVAVVLDRLK